MIYQPRLIDPETRRITQARIVPESLQEAQALAYLAMDITDGGYADMNDVVFVRWLETTQPECASTMKLVIFGTAFATACALGASLWLLQNR